MTEKRRPGKRKDISRGKPKPADKRAVPEKCDPLYRIAVLAEVVGDLTTRIERLETLCKPLEPWPHQFIPNELTAGKKGKTEHLPESPEDTPPGGITK